jgi:hypothetical protein
MKRRVKRNSWLRARVVAASVRSGRVALRALGTVERKVNEQPGQCSADRRAAAVPNSLDGST